MAKTTTIINHLEGLDDSTIETIGREGQVQLIKHETNKEDIHEFYDDTTFAEQKANEWKGAE